MSIKRTEFTCRRQSDFRKPVTPSGSVGRSPKIMQPDGAADIDDHGSIFLFLLRRIRRLIGTGENGNE